jgi:hypothetical protein
MKRRLVGCLLGLALLTGCNPGTGGGYYDDYDSYDSGHHVVVHHHVYHHTTHHVVHHHVVHHHVVHHVTSRRRR